MKNLKLILLFGGTLILLLTFQVQAQEIVETGQKTGLFSKIGGWIQGGAISLLVAFVGGIAAKHGWTIIAKKIAKKGAIITKEIGEFFGDTSTLLQTVDNAIKDDGTIEQNSIKEVLAAGKEVVIELKDMKAIFKPK